MQEYAEMIPKPLRGSPFLVQDPLRHRLERLYDRKCAIDELIRSLEDYGRFEDGPPVEKARNGLGARGKGASTVQEACPTLTASF
jgi:hypothetical protein